MRLTMQGLAAAAIFGAPARAFLASMLTYRAHGTTRERHVTMNGNSMRFVGPLSLSVLLAACGGAVASAPAPRLEPSASAAPTAGAPLAATAPVATSPATAVVETPKQETPAPGDSLKVVAMETVLPKVGTVVFKADGMIWTKLGDAGAVRENVLNFDNATLTVWNDNTVSVNSWGKRATFDGDDALVLPNGWKLTIDDNGKLELVRSDGTKDAKSSLTFTGFKPEARRTALLLGYMAFAYAPVPVARCVGPHSC